MIFWLLLWSTARASTMNDLHTSKRKWYMPNRVTGKIINAFFGKEEQEKLLRRNMFLQRDSFKRNKRNENANPKAYHVDRNFHEFFCDSFCGQYQDHGPSPSKRRPTSDGYSKPLATICWAVVLIVISSSFKGQLYHYHDTKDRVNTHAIEFWCLRLTMTAVDSSRDSSLHSSSSNLFHIAL